MPIHKGWSKDKKYFIETSTNEKRLLRLTDISEYEKKNNEFNLMEQLAERGIPMSKPIDFGICESGKYVYSLFTWCEGEDAEGVLPKMSKSKQYEMGVKSGQHLKEIHRIPASDDREEWAIYFNRKIDYKMQQYENCGIRINGGNKFIDYINAHRHLLNERPQSFQHGDYHIGNMVISTDDILSIIDFERSDFGDPWEEFNRIVWSATISPHFATGQLNGYFNGKPPLHFFKLLALYISSNTLSSISWATSFGEEEVEVMKNRAENVLTWFDQMNHPVPIWYLEDR